MARCKVDKVTDEIVKLRIGKHWFEALVVQASGSMPVTVEWGEPDDDGIYEPFILVTSPEVKELMGE